MTRNQRLLSVVLFLWASVLAGVMARNAAAAINRTPNGMFGALYTTSPSTLVSGDFDSLQIDSNHNLKVAGTVSPTPPPAASAPTQFGETSSNGVTAVTLVTATASQQIIPWFLTVYNTDTVNHKVRIISSGGTVLWSFVLAAATGVAVYDGNSDGYSMRTVASEGLQFVMPNFVAEGGSGGSVTALGWTTKQ